MSFPGNPLKVDVGCDILSLIHEVTLSSIVTVTVNSYSVTDVNRLNISTVSCHSSNNYSSSRQKDNSQENINLQSVVGNSFENESSWDDTDCWVSCGGGKLDMCTELMC